MVSRLVTPEAVLVELPTAGAASRALAKSIDVVVDMFIVSTVLGVATTVVELVGVSFIGPMAIAAFTVFVFLVVLPIGTELIWRGRSAGKAVMGLKVVGVDGARVTPRQVMVRGMVSLLEIYMSFGVLAFVASSLSPDGQRLGDMAAGTVVVRRRVTGTSMVPVAFHPPVGFEAYVSGLPTKGLHSEDVVLIRDYLLRVPGLTPAANHELGLELSRRVGERIGVDRPQHVDPRTWLVCVVSAQQFQPGGLLADAALGLAPLAPVGPFGGRGPVVAPGGFVPPPPGAMGRRI